MFHFKRRFGSHAVRPSVQKTAYEGSLRPNPAEIEKAGFWNPGEIIAALGTGRLSDNFEDEFHRYCFAFPNEMLDNPGFNCFTSS
ncbi:MAG: hypothetical protein ACOCR8_00850 [Desulfosalsimonas sp.]